MVRVNILAAAILPRPKISGASEVRMLNACNQSLFTHAPQDVASPSMADGALNSPANTEDSFIDLL